MNSSELSSYAHQCGFKTLVMGQKYLVYQKKGGGDYRFDGIFPTLHQAESYLRINRVEQLKKRIEKGEHRRPLSLEQEFFRRSRLRDEL